MFRFISALDNSTLCSRYLSKYDTADLNSKFDVVLSKHPNLKKVLPRGLKKADKILVAKFQQLAEIYFSYLKFTEKMSKTDIKALQKEIQSVFNYDSHSVDIADFLANPDNGFFICNCVYCDMERVRGYYDNTRHRIIREFETEHVLDKGKCPLLALSIFNFVPSCHKCNSPTHKGTKTLGKDKNEAVLLSPTSEDNKFNEEVKFTLSVLNPEILDLRFLENEGDVEIDFKGETNKYEQTLSIFHLKDRYNSRRTTLIEPIMDIRNHPPAIIKNIAKETRKSEDEIFEALFKFKKRKKEKAPMEKCRRELFSEIYGGIEWDKIKHLH